MRTANPGRGLITALLLALSGGLLVGCASDGSVSGPDAPDGHALTIDGVHHRSGLNEPLANCVGCHGSDLRGGPEGEPSCYSCHGEKWN